MSGAKAMAAVARKAQPLASKRRSRGSSGDTHRRRMRARLYRLRDALGLADDDAFWSIVMALEYYG